MNRVLQPKPPLGTHRLPNPAKLLDCGGKRSATPLLDRKSGVALRLPPQSKNAFLQSILAAVLWFALVTAGQSASSSESSASTAVNARHYEIGTNRPIFAGYDAIKRYTLADVPRERRTGSAWYGDWPKNLLTREYPEWRARVKSAK